MAHKRLREIDYNILVEAHPGWEDESGDIGFVKTFENQCFLGLVDVLVHASEAHVVALRALKYLEQHYSMELVELMQGLHLHLKGTRGAVAALCRLNIDSGELRFCGVGNISVRILGSPSHRFLSSGGIVGYMMTTPKEHTKRLFAGDTLLLYSDGIKERFELLDCPELLSGTATETSSKLMQTFGKGDDDMSCIVLRLKK